MDLETENRIAAILMKEAAELRRQAEKEGVLSYLHKPTVRGRPNSRFLTATVLGVQQANKAVEVNEMWRIRQKELELDNRLKGRSMSASRNYEANYKDIASNSRSMNRRLSVNDESDSASCSSGKFGHANIEPDEDEGLKDEEVEEFLNSRVKRGRGSVGSRMDETGPYLPSRADAENISSYPDARVQRVVCRPERPFPLKTCKSAEEWAYADSMKKGKRDHLESSKKKHSHKHRSKDKSADRRKKEKRSKDERRKDRKRQRLED
ncbi:hypothetical protein SAY87_024763 [Trapa incisa]|uniref:Uncharacterized protein n=1 Tax=Trapa incisa TaxID=236973 RepID=A0AAN7JG08_9MYRT|nr:hypothetical protein SAY87_024763 [Trapa incisa]